MVEVSPEMATRQIPSAQTVHDIILTSFEGAIKPGELFALWFYGSRLQTNAPIIWREGHEAAMARYSANLFGGRIFSKLRPRNTLADAAPFIAAAPKLTIFLFTDGSHPITGTPFDAAINSAIEQRYSLFQRADRPFVVTFIASKGKLLHGSVHSAVNERFRIPDLDRQDETLAKALEAVRNAPQPKPATSADLDKALAAVRNAAPTAAQTDADKARAALREALDGKTNASEKLAMQFSPTLKDPPQEDPGGRESPRALANTPPEQPKAVPPLLVRPTETTPQVVPASDGPSPVNPQPQNSAAPAATSPPKVVEPSPQPKPVEKPPDPKPTVAEQPKQEPKPIVREEPKPAPSQPPKTAIVETPRPAVTEPPKPIASAQPNQTAPLKAANPAPPAAKAPAVAEMKSQTNQTIGAKSAPPAPPIQTAALTPKSSFPWPALIGGLAVISFGGAIAILRAKRRSKSPGSIITQALPKNGPRFK